MISLPIRDVYMSADPGLDNHIGRSLWFQGISRRDLILVSTDVFSEISLVKNVLDQRLYFGLYYDEV